MYGGTEVQPSLSVIVSVLINTSPLLWCASYSFACSPCSWDLGFAGVVYNYHFDSKSKDNIQEPVIHLFHVVDATAKVTRCVGSTIQEL